MKVLATVSNPAIVSRFDELALATSIVIDSSVHASGEILPRGTLMGRNVSGGKYRAYAEGVVNIAFSTGNNNFGVDPAGPLAKHFRVGDAVESTGGTALGTIATYNPATGVGTLSGNSTNALGTTNKIRIATSQLALASAAGKVLQDPQEMEGTDRVATAYFEGFFIQANTSITAAALSALGGVTIDSGEVRLK